jgi:hypothetical protein
MLEEKKAIEAYIGTPKSVEYYKKAFQSYQIAGVDQFRWNWSWWAFGGGVFYLLYRKLYLEALVYFLIFIMLGFLPFISLILWIVSGGVLPYFVYKRYKKIKEQVETNLGDLDREIVALKELGGVNRWAIWLGIITSVLFWMVAFAVLSQFNN